LDVETNFEFLLLLAADLNSSDLIGIKLHFKLDIDTIFIANSYQEIYPSLVK
jgi:hypothetical protein